MTGLPELAARLQALRGLSQDLPASSRCCSLKRPRSQIWRPWSTFFMGGGGFPLIYDVFLIYRNSSSLEKDTL